MLVMGNCVKQNLILVTFFTLEKGQQRPAHLPIHASMLDRVSGAFYTQLALDKF